MKQTAGPFLEGNSPPTQVDASGKVPAVICHLDDSWSTLAAEAALIERWFGAEIAALFGD